ncbi:hypothetical protein EI42_04910 [Thermosporothrix hazakensis]|jgi:hypothetical protein|uniref:SPP1 Gp6-like portal protein n=1 Tax=Thermosporothrix hazakensis TaxID=644383 RepID=A0A326U088_THEHA|nr:hypothetical protein [Thermosporothrix hazakensis]PZW23527.1 hypothetical protein EI42_04910 [Thermosporothrix hazakensis]GCE51105.1 hypothetical protein KTH_59740 [Thermosporothrix hazakensis]
MLQWLKRPFRRVQEREEEGTWRALSPVYTPHEPRDIYARCYEAYHTNPLAFAIIEMTTAFVLGKGISIDAEHPRVRDVLRTFWNDPANLMDERIYQMCTELALYGEIFVRFFINKYDGTVRIRLIDPQLIDEIETDPQDIETPLRFRQRPTGAFSQQETWYRAGEEMLHFAINKVSNERRGSSDLITLLPWLQRYKDWLTDRVRINQYKSAFLYDVTVRGADRRTLDRKRLEYAYPPEPGSVIIHNEAEEWKAVQPNINANDAREDGRAIKLMIAAGAGLPEHYLADSSHGNRATASEMTLPTLLKFERRQRVIRHILSCILDRVIFEAQEAGRLSRHINVRYEISMPEIDVDDNQSLATAMHQMVLALGEAKMQGWVSDETAMRLLFKFAGEEVNVYDEIARIAHSRGLRKE